MISELMLQLFLKPSQSHEPNNYGFQTVLNRKKKRAFFKNMLTIKQINEEFDKKRKRDPGRNESFWYEFTICNYNLKFGTI